jgi:hypothetical protein
MRIAAPWQHGKIRLEFAHDVSDLRHRLFPPRGSRGWHCGVRKPQKDARRMFRSQPSKRFVGLAPTLRREAPTRPKPRTGMRRGAVGDENEPEGRAKT